MEKESLVQKILEYLFPKNNRTSSHSNHSSSKKFKLPSKKIGLQLKRFSRTDRLSENALFHAFKIQKKRYKRTLSRFKREKVAIESSSELFDEKKKRLSSLIELLKAGNLKERFKEVDRFIIKIDEAINRQYSKARFLIKKFQKEIKASKKAVKLEKLSTEVRGEAEKSHIKQVWKLQALHMVGKVANQISELRLERSEDEDSRKVIYYETEDFEAVEKLLKVINGYPGILIQQIEFLIPVGRAEETIRKQIKKEGEELKTADLAEFGKYCIERLERIIALAEQEEEILKNIEQIEQIRAQVLSQERSTLKEEGEKEKAEKQINRAEPQMTPAPAH